MPPFLMLIIVVFTLLMLMFGRNPVDKWREEAQKYGRDPLAREINKFNEKQGKKNESRKYTPPPGSTLYRLPPEQAQLKPSKQFDLPGEDNLVRPAPDRPMEEWGSPYPSHMMAPRGLSVDPQGGSNIIPPTGGGTSIVPGRLPGN